MNALAVWGYVAVAASLTGFAWFLCGIGELTFGEAAKATALLTGLAALTVALGAWL